MPGSPTKKIVMKVAGVILMAGLVIVPVVSACIAYSKTPMYFSAATVSMDTDDLGARYDAIKAVMTPYGANGDCAAIVGTSTYNLGVWDPDPYQAAVKANTAAMTLVQEHAFKVTIMERAEPALAPGRPVYHNYLLAGFGLGLVSFGVGLSIILIATRRVAE
jgi:hypothetical protein